MKQSEIYVLEDYNAGLICASTDAHIMRAKLREKYFSEILPYTIHECKVHSKSDEEFEENLIEVIQEDIRQIEEYMSIEDCFYVYSIPVVEET